jgi:hypothetical protein
MPLLFSYGTLQESDVQRALFDRLLAGEQDELVGFVAGQVPIDDEVARVVGRTHYDNVIAVDDRARRVMGVAYEVSEAELIRADGYETPAGYERIATVLASGRRSWVYLHPGSR